MSKTVEVGSVLQGKVIQIKPFGAFIELENKARGLVHISQVSHEYIKDISEVLSEGDTVTVKVISIDAETNKISLSIKETQPKPEPQKRAPRFNTPEPPKPSVNLEDML